MKLNNYSKMRRAQKKVKEYLLINKKYDLVYIVPHSRWNKDIFGLFDGGAVKKGEFILFQVKSNRKPQMQPFKDFYDKFQIPFKIYVVKDRGGIKEYGN